jgi:hypothetical protein
MQIPYEYLTPLQAAVGVVQKVKISNFIFFFYLAVLFVLFLSGICSFCPLITFV